MEVNEGWTEILVEEAVQLPFRGIMVVKRAVNGRWRCLVLSATLLLVRTRLVSMTGTICHSSLIVL